MTKTTEVLKEATRLRRIYETSEESQPLPEPEELVEEALHNLRAHEAVSAKTFVDLYIKTLVGLEKHSRRVTLESDPTANGSLARARAFFFSISCVGDSRKALWGNTRPLFPAELGKDGLAKALDQVWTWIQASPRVERYKESVITEVGADGSELIVKQIKNLLKPMAFPMPTGNQFVETPLPYTCRAYSLSNIVNEFIDRAAGSQETSWWRPGWTAVYLTTGHFERSALPRWEVTADTQSIAGKRRGYAHIRVYDVASVSPSELADAYTRTRLQMTEQPSIPKFEITSGRPEEYSTEVLAQLELELILKKAEERLAKGQSICPEVWNERPRYKELETAWRERAAAAGVDPEKRLTPQSLSNFRSRVRRELYEQALSQMCVGNQMCVEENNQKAIKADYSS